MSSVSSVPSVVESVCLGWRVDLKIIDAGNKRALARVFAVNHSEDRAFERRVAAIVSRVRDGGDAALLRFAR